MYGYPRTNGHKLDADAMIVSEWFVNAFINLVILTIIDKFKGADVTPDIVSAPGLSRKLRFSPPLSR
jgi:hypothetical protein